MDLFKFLSRIHDNVKGFLEVSRIQTPRYSFVVEKFDITYQGVSIKTKIQLVAIGHSKIWRRSLMMNLSVENLNLIMPE